MTLSIHLAAATPGAGEFLGVDWASIAEVTVVTLVAAVAIVTLYAVGLRLLAVGQTPDPEAPTAGPSARPIGATLGAYACIGVGVLAVFYGIYLVVPLFHAH